jgi:hypothetical protein
MDYYVIDKLFEEVRRETLPFSSDARIWTEVTTHAIEVCRLDANAIERHRISGMAASKIFRIIKMLKTFVVFNILRSPTAALV